MSKKTQNGNGLSTSEALGVTGAVLTGLSIFCLPLAFGAMAALAAAAATAEGSDDDEGGSTAGWGG